MGEIRRGGFLVVFWGVEEGEGEREDGGFEDGSVDDWGADGFCESEDGGVMVTDDEGARAFG